MEAQAAALLNNFLQDAGIWAGVTNFLYMAFKPIPGFKEALKRLGGQKEFAQVLAMAVALVGGYAFQDEKLINLLLSGLLAGYLGPAGRDLFHKLILRRHKPDAPASGANPAAVLLIAALSGPALLLGCTPTFKGAPPDPYLASLVTVGAVIDGLSFDSPDKALRMVRALRPAFQAMDVFVRTLEGPVPLTELTGRIIAAAPADKDIKFRIRMFASTAEPLFAGTAVQGSDVKMIDPVKARETVAGILKMLDAKEKILSLVGARKQK